MRTASRAWTERSNDSSRFLVLMSGAPSALGRRGPRGPTARLSWTTFGDTPGTSLRTTTVPKRTSSASRQRPRLVRSSASPWPRRRGSRKPPRPAASSRSARSLLPRPICSKFLFYGAVCTAAQPARASSGLSTSGPPLIFVADKLARRKAASTISRRQYTELT